MKKSIIIGLGTGRCGTVSLANLLNSQRDTSVTHENDRHTMPWIVNEVLFESAFEKMCQRPGTHIGDVAFFWLPYASKLLEVSNNTVKFVILQRDKQQTCESYDKKTAGRNHWQVHDGTTYRHDNIWDQCYPKVDSSLSRVQAIESYYDQYYNLCSHLPEENTFRIETHQLNDESTCLNMLQFCGFESSVWEKNHMNRGK